VEKYLTLKNNKSNSCEFYHVLIPSISLDVCNSHKNFPVIASARYILEAKSAYFFFDLQTGTTSYYREEKTNIGTAIES
jgi:hypothetical protein